MSGETESNISGWTTDTLREHLQRQIDDLRVMLDERYGTQTKAIDAAFIAQQTAMQTALTAAERAVQTASAAAEKAVLKAEAAAEKRFEAVNEFRAQLNDQAATFMPRELADAQLAELRKTADTNARSISELLGAGVGSQGQRSEARLDQGASNVLSQMNSAKHQVQIAAVVAAIAFVSLVATIIVAIVLH